MSERKSTVFEDPLETVKTMIGPDYFIKANGKMRKSDLLKKQLQES
jgi:hypothetical protein